MIRTAGCTGSSRSARCCRSPHRPIGATLLRSGDKTAWLEVVLEEGRNRHIRRLLAAFDINVLRLVRVAIGQLPLGELGKGAWRELSQHDLDLLHAVADSAAATP